MKTIKYQPVKKVLYETPTLLSSLQGNVEYIPMTLDASILNEVQELKISKAVGVTRNRRGIHYIHLYLNNQYVHGKRDNFLDVVNKAKQACNNSGKAESDHFADVSKTIAMPKGSGERKQPFALQINHQNDVSKRENTSITFLLKSQKNRV
ncbi:MAG: hypothetical protein WC606_05460 [Candidatus Absconditabacterales bacterium]